MPSPQRRRQNARKFHGLVDMAQIARGEDAGCDGAALGVGEVGFGVDVVIV